MASPYRLIRPALNAFARELRVARIHAGMSQHHLARRAGMTRQGLAKIEKGGNVTVATLILLTHALGCQIANLFPRKSPWN
jgi:transcriptional regulator with XRE-family HTH domain